MQWKRIYALMAALAVSGLMVGCNSGSSSSPNSSSTPGAAAKLAFSTQPVSTTAGAAFSVVVQIQDANGNLVTTSNASVTLTPSSSSLSGTNTVTASGGVATFSGLSLNAAGSYTLTASSSGLTSAASSSFTISAATASRLVFTTQPSSASVGGSIGTVVVKVEDASGNVITGSSASVTLALSSTSATLAGTATVAASSGVATFSGLSVNTAGTYTLTASSSGLTSATSSSFTIGSASASKLVFTTQPSSASVGGSIGTVVVKVEDASNNVITGSSASVTLTLSSTSATLAGTATVAASSGVATFSGLSVNTAGSYTLTASSSGLTSATSSSFTIGSAPTSLTVSVNQNNVPNGMVGMPYTFSSQLVGVSGGSGNYSYTYSNKPTWAAESSGSLVSSTLPGTSGTSSGVQVNVVDNNNSSLTGSATFNITIEPTDSANNAKLSGQYACYLDRFWPGGSSSSGLYRGGMLFAFTANGAGLITGGKLDSNAAGSGYASGSIASGSYSVGADQRGALILSSSSGSLYFALSASNVNASSYLSTLALVEMDDVGSSPSNKTGTGRCYRQNASSLSSYWSTARSFAYGFRGETSSGAVMNMVGSVAFDGVGAVYGEMDSVTNGVFSASPGVSQIFTYTPGGADSYGRITLIPSGGNNLSAVAYATNNTLGQALVMSTNGHNSSNFFLGEARLINASNIKAGNFYPMSGNSAVRASGLNSSLKYKAMLAQVTGSPSAQTITMNVDIENDNASISATKPAQQVTYTYSPSADLARAYITNSSGNGGGYDIFYFYDTGAAAILIADGSPVQSLLGWVEPQQTNGGAWTAGSLGGATYALYQSPNGDYTQAFRSGAFALSSSGAFNSLSMDSGQADRAAWANPWTDNSGNAVSGQAILDATLDPSGIYGVFDIRQTAAGVTKTGVYCIGVNMNSAATSGNYKGKLACMNNDNTESSPMLSIITE